MNTMNYSVIIVAGGKGTRTHLDYNKVFRILGGRALIEYPLKSFKNDADCKEIILVINPDDYAFAKDQFSGLCDKIIKGGKSRRESVYNGLEVVSNPYVMIHDGARPYVSTAVLKRLKKGLQLKEALSPAIKVPDTLKRVENDLVSGSVNRENLVGIQTPQAFKTKTIKKAHAIAKRDALEATCDLSLVEDTLNIPGFIVQGDVRTMKYTHENDDLLLELILNDANRTKS